MKVLLVGGGGREHALAWKIKQDDSAITLFAAPGNPGIAALGRCVPIDVTDTAALLALARREAIDLTIVGPEAALAAGIVDCFRTAGAPVFGPTRAAAEIESSKAFAKGLMRDAGIPTANAVVCRSVSEARVAIERLGAPVVVKASGLAAGKGVAVCETVDAARRAAIVMLEGSACGAAGETILVEEFMEGEELSVFALTDGVRVVPLIASQDHKRLLDGDQGPNTGGMGAYAPVSIAEPESRGYGAQLIDRILREVLQPAVNALSDRGRPFTGLLYAGLMLTGDGPKVVEFNCRFGDPETEAVLPVMELRPSLLSLMLTVGGGERLPETIQLRSRGYAVTTVLAAAGYPYTPRIGDPIVLPPPSEDVLVFHAGTSLASDGRLVTSGGRVLAITGIGPTMDAARAHSVAHASSVMYAGKQFRADIGWREMARRAGTP